MDPIFSGESVTKPPLALISANAQYRLMSDYFWKNRSSAPLALSYKRLSVLVVMNAIGGLKSLSAKVCECPQNLIAESPIADLNCPQMSAQFRNTLADFLLSA